MLDIVRINVMQAHIKSLGDSGLTIRGAKIREKKCTKLTAW